MNFDVLGIVVDVVLPSLAIIISTLVALRLSRTERQDAALARRNERIDDAFARTLEPLTVLSTANLFDDNYRDVLREVRLSLILLREYSWEPNRAEDWHEWANQERENGMRIAENIVSPPQRGSTGSYVITFHAHNQGDILSVPFQRWALEFANAITEWRRTFDSSPDLSDLITRSKSHMSSANSSDKPSAV